ncbi:MAG: hypothetical protein WKF73_14190 [Nocardioidaceae bacterium]
MSLYRYVPGREDLLDAVVETIIDEMYEDEDILQVTSGRLARLPPAAGAWRTAGSAGPSLAFPLVASRPPEAPWLRPPLRNLQWVESFLNGLTGEGFSDEAAVCGIPRVHELLARPPAAGGGRKLEPMSDRSTSSMTAMSRQTPNSRSAIRTSRRLRAAVDRRSRGSGVRRVSGEPAGPRLPC